MQPIILTHAEDCNGRGRVCERRPIATTTSQLATDRTSIESSMWTVPWERCVKYILVLGLVDRHWPAYIAANGG